MRLYHTGIKVIALWNPKAKLWIKVRKKFPAINNGKLSGKVVWMHCASLGEFEQGRPVLEKIKLLYPDCKAIITFFSPSGYEIIKNYKGADHIFYLPMDSSYNAKKFVGLINPSLVIWVKYEYWYYYLNEIKKKNIAALLISGVYTANMPFFKWYGNIWKKMLNSFTHFFVQNQQSKKKLETLVSSKKITNSGDTRFDRVIAVAEKFEEIKGINEFCKNNKVVVAGSTWEADEAELTHYVKTHPEIKFIIAPHEIDKENLKDVKKEFPNSIFYSEWIMANEQQATGNMQTTNGKPETRILNPESRNCLIIDNIGMLSRLYKYADVTYVGGGFGSDGLHNILEAAVYGKPVIFGPEYENNFEAVELIECGGAISIENALELEETLNDLLNNETELNRRAHAARNFVHTKAGATEKIINFIQLNRLLTN